MAEFETPHFMNQTAVRNENTVHAFRMRFVSFQDPNEFHVDNVLEINADFDEYLIQEPCRLKEVSLTPYWTQGYAIENISVPRGTDVITFYNLTSHRTGPTNYRICFNYTDPHENYDLLVQTPTGMNRFVVKPTPDKSRLRTVEYDIGINDSNTFRESDCQVSELTNTGEWILRHSSPHEKPRRNLRPIRTMRLVPLNPAFSVTPI